MLKPLLIFFLILFSFNAYAVSEQEQNNSIDDQNRLIQRQQQIEQEQLKQKELQQIEKEWKKIQEEESEEKLSEQEPSGFVDVQCFRIEKIIFSPNKIISKFRQQKLSENYLGRCLTLAQIKEFSKKISDYLIDRGYVTSRVEILPQSLSQGVLEIIISEAFLEKITFNQEKFSDKTQKFSAFGLVKKNEILNLRKIEQGLEQINRLESNSATIKILPAGEKNSSILAVENVSKGTLRPQISYDNSGSKLTGKRRDSIGFSKDNLFYLNDNFTINRTANSIDVNRDDHGTKAINASFSLPFSWYNLTLNYSKSSYFFHAGDITRFESSGHTSTKSAALDRVLIKERKFKLTSNFSLTSKYNQSFIDDVKVEASSKKASIASAGLSSLFFFDNSTLFLKPSYAKSLKILDAKKNATNLSRDSVHAEFDIFKFYGNYAQKLQILQTPISYNFSFDSQISKQRLYSVDQFYVGGVYSVRGFSEGSISGDSGYNIKNEITVNLGNLILPYSTSNKASQNLRYFSLTPFYDYGYIRQKGGQQDGRVSGGGLKISFNHQNLTTALSFARVLSKSKLLGDDYREERAVYFTINAEFGLF